MDGYHLLWTITTSSNFSVNITSHCLTIFSTAAIHKAISTDITEESTQPEHYRNNRDIGVLPFQASDVASQIQRLVIIGIPDTGIHQLRHLQDLQQLGVPLEGEDGQTPTVNGKNSVVNVKFNKRENAHLSLRHAMSYVMSFMWEGSCDSSISKNKHSITHYHSLPMSANNSELQANI